MDNGLSSHTLRERITDEYQADVKARYRLLMFEADVRNLLRAIHEHSESIWPVIEEELAAILHGQYQPYTLKEEWPDEERGPDHRGDTGEPSLR